MPPGPAPAMRTPWSAVAKAPSIAAISFPLAARVARAAAGRNRAGRGAAGNITYAMPSGLPRHACNRSVGATKGPERATEEPCPTASSAGAGALSLAALAAATGLRPARAAATHWDCYIYNPVATVAAARGMAAIIDAVAQSDRRRAGHQPAPRRLAADQHHHHHPGGQRRRGADGRRRLLPGQRADRRRAAAADAAALAAGVRHGGGDHGAVYRQARSRARASPCWATTSTRRRCSSRAGR